MSDPLIVWGLITAASIDKHSDLGGRGVVLQGGNHQSTWQFGHLRTHTQKQFYHHQGIQQNRSLEKDGTSIQYLKKITLEGPNVWWVKLKFKEDADSFIVRQPPAPPSSSLPNIHGRPGRSGQHAERDSDQPGAVQGTGLLWQPHRSVSVEEKDTSTDTDLHILGLKLYTLGGPSEFHLTGCLGRVKSCLEK